MGGGSIYDSVKIKAADCGAAIDLLVKAHACGGGRASVGVFFNLFGLRGSPLPFFSFFFFFLFPSDFQSLERVF